MCGIFGFSVTGLHREPERVMEEMLAVLRHRGPDDAGCYSDEVFALGNALLSIVDIGHGRQPFVIDYLGERFVGVYNGEVYNWLELRRELESHGFRFRTMCDSEVVVAAVAAWGEGALVRFEGQWSLAVWNATRRRLMLSRDPFGIKPLYYWAEGGRIAFASEPKALFLHPDIPRRPNEEAIQEYLLHGFAFAAGYATGSRSFYGGIASLPAGHSLSWAADQGKVALQSRFVIPFAEEDERRGTRELAEELRDAVWSSVAACLMGDATVGTALSGGLDSSVITAVAAREKMARGEPPLLACAIRYTQAVNPDAEHAALLAGHLESEAPIHLVNSVLDAKSYIDRVDKMIWHFDEPHWEPKQLAMFENYAVLRRHGAKVVLTGEGADELFFGYYHRFPGFLHPVVHSGRELRDLLRNRRGAAISVLTQPDEQHLEGLMAEAVDRYYEPYIAAGYSPARAMQAWYLHTFLHWLLIDNDRCSMAHSLEGRFPFLNRRVFELAVTIPFSIQVATGHGAEKLVLREAFRDILPGAIATRAKAPLPSPMRLEFHQAIADGFDWACEHAPASLWDIVSRSGASQLGLSFRGTLADLQRRGRHHDGGTELTSYLTLQEPYRVRTPQVFAMMTLARWWALNFN